LAAQRAAWTVDSSEYCLAVKLAEHWAGWKVGCLAAMLAESWVAQRVCLRAEHWEHDLAECLAAWLESKMAGEME